MNKKINNIYLGIAVGILAPVLSYFVVFNYIYPFEFADKPLQTIWLQTIAPRVISLAALPNLGFFFLFIYTNKLLLARGVLASTIFLALVVFALKLLW